MHKIFYSKLQYRLGKGYGRSPNILITLFSAVILRHPRVVYRSDNDNIYQMFSLFTPRLYCNIKVLNENLTANGKIINYEVVDGDGVYINYKDGADTVRKKLGSGEYSLLNSYYASTGKTNGGSRTLEIPSTYAGQGVFVLCQDDKQASSYRYGATINTTPQTMIFSRDGNGVSTRLAYLPNIKGCDSVTCSWTALDDYPHWFSVYIFGIG